MILCALSSFDCHRLDLAASAKIFYGCEKGWETKIKETMKGLMKMDVV